MQFSGYSMVSRELKLRYRISKNPAHYEMSAFGGKADVDHTGLGHRPRRVGSAWAEARAGGFPQ